MVVRGAPLIGATAAYGLALALRRESAEVGLEKAHRHLAGARPTAVNLRHALDDIRAHVVRLAPPERAQAALIRVAAICEEACRELHDLIGEAGLPR